MGLGDAFVVRNAGQVISDSVLGSLEYAVGVLDVPLILVLGHDECGAVSAAIDSQAPDARPLPAAHRDARRPDRPGRAARRRRRAGGADLARRRRRRFVGREHLRDTVAELLERSEIISDAVAAGTLAIVGANYRLRRGRVETDIVLGRI